MIRFILHRPRSSQNIGAAARALANTGAGALWTVEPIGFDRAQAAKLAAGADCEVGQTTTVDSARRSSAWTITAKRRPC